MLQGVFAYLLIPSSSKGEGGVRGRGLGLQFAFIMTIPTTQTLDEDGFFCRLLTSHQLTSAQRRLDPSTPNHLPPMAPCSRHKALMCHRHQDPHPLHLSTQPRTPRDLRAQGPQGIVTPFTRVTACTTSPLAQLLPNLQKLLASLPVQVHLEDLVVPTP